MPPELLSSSFHLSQLWHELGVLLEEQHLLQKPGRERVVLWAAQQSLQGFCLDQKPMGFVGLKRWLRWFIGAACFDPRFAIGAAAKSADSRFIGSGWGGFISTSKLVSQKKLCFQITVRRSHIWYHYNDWKWLVGCIGGLPFPINRSQVIWSKQQSTRCEPLSWGRRRHGAGKSRKSWIPLQCDAFGLRALPKIISNHPKAPSSCCRAPCPANSWFCSWTSHWRPLWPKL